jgi:hypothetical protein
MVDLEALLADNPWLMLAQQNGYYQPKPSPVPMMGRGGAVGGAVPYRGF